MAAVTHMVDVLKSGEPATRTLYETLVMFCMIIGMLVGPTIWHYVKHITRRRATKASRKRQLEELERRLQQQQGPGHIPITICAICLEDLPTRTTTNTNNNNPNENPETSEDYDLTSIEGLRHRGGGGASASSSSASAAATPGPDATTGGVDPNERPKMLFCGHKFHKICINEWLAKNNSCPVCRRNDPTMPDEPPQAPHKPSTMPHNRVRPAGADLDFLLFTRGRMGYYSVWHVPPMPRTHTGGGGGRRSGGRSSWGGGSSFGGGGGGGGW